MSKTLYDIIDSWTMNWNRGTIEIILGQVAKFFYRRKCNFFLLEEIWDALEFIDDPLEFMTDDRKIEQIENILRNEQNELAAKFVKIEFIESPEPMIAILNVDETISQHPEWFEPWDEVNVSEFDNRFTESGDVD